MNTFFTQLAASMQDKQNMKLELSISKVGDEITVLAIEKGRFNTVATSTPEEMDEFLAPEILRSPEKGGFKAKHVESDDKDSEDEDEADDKSDREDKKVGSKKAVTKKEVAKKEASKPAAKVAETKTTTKSNMVRYSDTDLAEFKTLIDSKLDDAHSELNGIKDKTLNTGLEEMERVKLLQRQQKLIENLEQAMIKVDNKTYGICRVTGKLISKERLLAVPHATLAIEGKDLKSETEDPIASEPAKVEPKAEAPVKAEPKVDAKAESARIDNEFTVLMHEGKALFKDRNYQGALDKFQAALKLKPEDQEAIKESNNAYKWVIAVAKANL